MTKEQNKAKKLAKKAKKAERQEYLDGLRKNLRNEVVRDMRAAVEKGKDKDLAREEALERLDYGLAKIQKIKNVKEHKYLADRRELAKQGLLPPKPPRSSGLGASWQRENKEKGVVVETVSTVPCQARAERRKARAEEAAAIPDFLRETGWSQSEVDPNVWSRPNWDISGGECSRTLRQAYKIQLGLSARGV